MKFDSKRESIELLRQRLALLEKENNQLRELLDKDQLTHHATDSKLIQSIPFIFLLINSKEEIVDANEHAIKFFKAKIPNGDSRIVGLRIDHLIDPKDKLDVLMRKARDGQPADGEFLIDQNTKNPVWLECFLNPVMEPISGEVEHISFIALDDSERKATELAIRESQELYRSLIELSPEGILIINEGRIEFANREFIKMLKVVREKQIVERKFLDLVLLKDHASVRKWLRRVKQFKADDEMILAELKRFDGSSLLVEMMATPITIRGEKSAQLFVRDVTQRIHTGKELSKERELNENLIKSIPDYIYFKDTQGKFIKINKAFSKVLGLKVPQDAVGKSDKDFFGVKHYRLSQKEEKQIIKTKKPLIGAIRKEPWPTEEVQWVSVTKMPLYGPDREVIGVFGVSRDITKQKQSEEELRIREERFRHFFGQIQVGMAIIDSSYDIQEVNAALCAITGSQRKNLINKKLVSLFDIPHHEEIRENISKLHTGILDEYHAEVTLLKQNGKSRYVILQIKKLDDTADFKDQLLCQVLDIHDRKVAEEQLLVRNDELNNFVYKVSHDLRSPLRSVKGLVNLLRMEKSPEQQENYIGMIENRIEKLDGFIQDLLSHSKSLGTEIKMGPVDLKGIIANCFSEMEYHANFSKIDKKVDVKGVTLHSDELRLQEIMRNLISNAIIYSSSDRPNSYVRVKVRCGAKMCTIVVEDNGIGIKRTYLDKVFQMFFRANDKVDGSGIGLYIVHQSVQKLGGEIQVDSKLNSGTKFTITLPNNTPNNF